MIPRLTKRGRKLNAKYPLGVRFGIRIKYDLSRPSPSERRKARHQTERTYLRRKSARDFKMLAWAHTSGDV